MKMFNEKIVVGTVPTPVFSFTPHDLHSVIIESDCTSSIDIGAASVVSGDGLKLVDGATLSFAHRDFIAAAPGLVNIYAIGRDATDAVRVFGWRR